jgi:uncharacterized membrane protein YqjE
MTDGNGMKPPETAEKSLGAVVGDVSEKASLLVREEIELAKAEVSLKISRIGKGAAAGAVAGVFAFFAVVLLFEGLAWLVSDLVFSLSNPWTGFFVMTGVLLLLGAIGGLIALRLFKRGTPPTPEIAIEEAKKTRAAIEEARR